MRVGATSTGLADARAHLRDLCTEQMPRLLEGPGFV